MIQLAESYLKDHTIDRPKRIAEELLAHVLGMKRIDLYLHWDRLILPREWDEYWTALQRCAQQEPIEYVLGSIDFYGCKIAIDARVLIPRLETELMVDWIAKEVEEGTLWDLCTGSGCIGLALKKKKPRLQVTLADLSLDALEVAQKNAQGMDVDIVHGDLLEPFVGKKADFIVCNPPYISEGDWNCLSPSVREFEPKIALTSGKTGTEIYEKLAEQVGDFLNPGGKLFFEIGFDQGDRLQEIFKAGSWVNRRLIQDFASHDRFFFLEKEGILE